MVLVGGAIRIQIEHWTVRAWSHWRSRFSLGCRCRARLVSKRTFGHSACTQAIHLSLLAEVRQASPVAGQIVRQTCSTLCRLNFCSGRSLRYPPRVIAKEWIAQRCGIGWPDWQLETIHHLNPRPHAHHIHSECKADDATRSVMISLTLMGALALELWSSHKSWWFRRGGRLICGILELDCLGSVSDWGSQVLSATGRSLYPRRTASRVKLAWGGASLRFTALYCSRWLVQAGRFGVAGSREEPALSCYLAMSAVAGGARRRVARAGPLHVGRGLVSAWYGLCLRVARR